MKWRFAECKPVSQLKPYKDARSASIKTSFCHFSSSYCWLVNEQFDLHAWPHNKGKMSVTNSSPNKMLRKYIKLSWWALQSLYCLALTGSDPGAESTPLHLNPNMTETAQCWGGCFDWWKQTIPGIIFLIFRLLRLHILVNVCQIFSILYEKWDLLQTKSVLLKFFWLLEVEIAPVKH